MVRGLVEKKFYSLCVVFFNILGALAKLFEESGGKGERSKRPEIWVNWPRRRVEFGGCSARMDAN
jgi:hypothetical protein